MYIGGEGPKVVAAVPATAAVATILPNTGSNTLVTLAVSVAAGLLTWGVIYSRQGK